MDYRIKSGNDASKCVSFSRHHLHTTVILGLDPRIQAASAVNDEVERS